MRAQQLIYTACGKNKNGAYSIWSKSEGIPDVESDEIIKLMAYRKPKNAPYEPTEEELKTCFPKKIGYFIFPTGRACIAQSTYTGRVYSDSDRRLGNFIIHAYIFDQNKDFCPFFIFGSDIFKTELSYKEWHDDPCPESLPAVDINIKPVLDREGINDFLKDDRKRSVFVSILQAVLDSRDKNVPITFNFNERDERAVYELLGLVLPQKYFQGATFLTQYNEQEYYFTSNNIPMIKIRNIFDAEYNFSFNYSEAVNSGQYAFYFDKGQIAKVRTGQYAGYTERMLRQENLSGISARVKKITDIMGKYNCDPDLAVNICNLLDYRLEAFATPGEFEQTVSLINGTGYDKTAMLNAIYKRFTSGGWSFDGQAGKLINYLFVNADNSVKDELIIRFFKSADKFGVNSALSYEAWIESVKKAMPFDYTEAAKSLYRNRFTYRGQPLYEKPAKDVNVAVLIFDLTCKIANAPNADKSVTENVYRELAVYENMPIEKNREMIAFLFRELNSLKSDKKDFVLERLYNDIFNTVCNESDIKKALAWILAAGGSEDRIYFLAKFIERFGDNPYLFPYYAEFASANRALSDQAEQRLRGAGKSGNFFRAKENFIVNERQKQFRQKPVGEEELARYFEEVYLRGFDADNLYFSKAEAYVNGDPEKELRLYNRLFNYPPSKKTAEAMIRLEELIFKTDTAEYLNKDADSFGNGKDRERNIRTFSGNVMNRCRNCKGCPDITGRCDCLFTLLLFNGWYDTAIMRDAARDSSSVYGLAGQSFIDFLKYHTADALIGYCTFKKNKIAAKEVLLQLFFGPVFSLKNVAPYVERELEKLQKKAYSEKTYYEIIADFADYGFNEKDVLAGRLYDFLDWHLKKADRRQVKKLGDKIRKLIGRDRYRNIEAFIENLSKPAKSGKRDAKQDETKSQKAAKCDTKRDAANPWKDGGRERGKEVTRSKQAKEDGAKKEDERSSKPWRPFSSFFTKTDDKKKK